MVPGFLELCKNLMVAYNKSRTNSYRPRKYIGYNNTCVAYSYSHMQDDGHSISKSSGVKNSLISTVRKAMLLLVFDWIF